MQQQKVQLLGENINYIFENTGKIKILFLHGFNSSLKFAADIYKKPNRNFDVVAFDFPGCGASTANNPISIEFYQQIALAFVDYLQLKDFVIVAHSLGGASALKLLAEREVKHAILGAPINYNLVQVAKENVIVKLQSWLLPSNIAEAKESTRNLVARNIEFYTKNIENIAKSFLSIVALKKDRFKEMVNKQILNPSYLNNNIKELYDKAPDKYSFIVGDKDMFVPSKTIQAIGQEKNKVVNILKNCGHALFYEYPEEILHLIENVLDEVGPEIAESLETISEI